MKYERNSYTLAILVNNRSGVLMRVVALFSRRGYNIDSLSVGETEDPATSRITIVVTGDRQIVEQIIRQVEKLVDVRKVYEMTQHGSLQRELVLVKIKADEETRSKIAEIAAAAPHPSSRLRRDRFTLKKPALFAPIAAPVRTLGASRPADPPKPLMYSRHFQWSGTYSLPWGSALGKMNASRLSRRNSSRSAANLSCMLHPIA